MEIEKDKLVNRSVVLNKDIQLGIVATQVATWASMVNQLELKLERKTITDEEFNSSFNQAKEYIESAHLYCKENGLDWNVCKLVARDTFERFI